MTIFTQFVSLGLRQYAFRQFDTTKPGVVPSGADRISGVQRLSTESVGVTTITLTGVRTGSEINIFDDSGVLLGSNENVSGSPSFNLPRYVSGSPKNSVRIFISSLAYENVDLTYELTAIDSSIPIFQRRDRNYRNPV